MALAGTFWGLKVIAKRQTVSPKSWKRSRKSRISNSSTESQKKEKVSPPGWYGKNPGVCAAEDRLLCGRQPACFLFKKRKAESSKYCTLRQWRTEWCLISRRFWCDICSGTGRHLLGPESFAKLQTACPKILKIKQKIKNYNRQCAPNSDYEAEN